MWDPTGWMEVQGHWAVRSVRQGNGGQAAGRSDERGDPELEQCSQPGFLVAARAHRSLQTANAIRKRK